MLTAHVTLVALGVASTMVLARLLTPQDFGFVALTGAFLGIVLLLRGFGLPGAIIQREEISHSHVSRLFWINLKLSVLLGALLAAAAPALAWFYGQPGLIPLTLILAVGVTLSSLGYIHFALLRRQMRFGLLAVIDIGAYMLGAAVGITAAWLGAGYWALVSQQMAVYLAQAIAPWFACSWRPGLSRDDGGQLDLTFQSLLSYGKYATWAKFGHAADENAPLVVIGYFAELGAVGSFQKAFQWSLYPFQQLYWALLNVFHATFSRLQHDVGAYGDAVRKAFLVLFSLTMPMMAFLFVEAEAFIGLLLGDQWNDVVPLFRVLLIGAVGSSLSGATRWLYLAEGRARTKAIWAGFGTGVTILAALIGAIWGVTGVAIACTIVQCVLAYPAVRVCLLASPLRERDFWRGIWRPGLSAAAAGCGLWILHLGLLFPERLLFRVGTSALAFGLLYSVVWLVIPGGRKRLAETVALLRRTPSTPAPDDQPVAGS
jgi:PST family polysaccharide transporter